MTSQSLELDGDLTEVRVPCEVYSRVVGYLRPVQAWNDAKRQEYEERVPFDDAVADARFSIDKVRD